MKCTQCNGFGYIDNLEGDGLICPKCNGTGECEPFDTDIELDKLYPTEQTNEEWFCELPTEEKAKWLENKMTWAAQEQGTFTVKGWEMWLKQPHKE